MKRIVSFVVFVFLSCLVFSVVANPEITIAQEADSAPAITTPAVDYNKLQLVKEFDGGKLYEKGKINIVELQGDYYQMGRQYGALLKTKLEDLYKILIHDYYFKKHTATYRQFERRIAEPAWHGYPKREKEIFRGIAKTSGMSIEELVLLNENTFIRSFEHMFGVPKSNANCSYIAAWGKYVRGRKTIVGRNFDFPLIYGSLGSYLTVTIFKPTDGSNYAATVGYVGMIGPLAGINNKGLYLSTNSAAATVGTVLVPNRTSFLIENLNFLFDADGLKDLDSQVHTVRTNYPLILCAANGNASYVYEDAPQEVVERMAKSNGLLVATNQFRAPSWGIAPKAGAAYSMDRYDNLMKLAKKHKGRITYKVMKKILELPILNADGSLGTGPSFLFKQDGLDMTTAQQIVAIPAKLQMWIRVPGYNEWTEINLKKFF